MQSKLATWSTENEERKFDRLLRLMANRSWLSEAASITLASSGARTPGVDGINKRKMVEMLDLELERLQRELLTGTYSPLPARRVYIPKANGKLRPLGIPCLRDRIVQRAMLMAMEPIWEFLALLWKIIKAGCDTVDYSVPQAREFLRVESFHRYFPIILCYTNLINGWKRNF
jgi:retron-type reverse transcriptase